jgi:hypothetical protein
VTITGGSYGQSFGKERNDRPPTPEEVIAALAAMKMIEPFEMSAEERTEAEAWEKKVKDYTIATMDKGIEDLFP